MKKQSKAASLQAWNENHIVNKYKDQVFKSWLVEKEEKLMMDHINPEKAVKELTMLLMYLQRFNEKGRFESALDMAWKGYDFDIINELDNEDYIRQGSHRSKSVVITDKGMALARELLNKYNISDWK